MRKKLEKFCFLRYYHGDGNKSKYRELYGRNIMATEKKKPVSKKAPAKKTEPAKETEQVKVDTEAVKVEEATEKAAEEKAATKKTTTRKTTTRKTATKTATKKTTTTKQPATRRTTTKKVPKSVFLECYGQQIKIDMEKYEEEVKNIWLNDWKRPAKDLKEIDMYIKPEDGKVYFVVNGIDHGALAI